MPHRLVSFKPLLTTLVASASLGLIACDAELNTTPMDSPPPMMAANNMPAPNNNITDPGPKPLPDVPPKTRPDGIPIPGTDTCRPPAERLWQLSPFQLTRSMQGVAPAGTVGNLQSRLELYAARGNPYSADPNIINGSTLLLTELFSTLRTVADGFMTEPPMWAACLKEDAPGEPCIQETLTQLGRRAYRRPLEQAELDTFMKMYRDKKAELDHDAATQLVIRRLLNAPPVLFRSERGVMDPKTGIATLTPYELADWLSYTLTDGPPDAELRQAADDGSLSDPEVMRAQAKRLLDVQPELDSVIVETIGAPRLVTGPMRFFREWLDVDATTNATRPELNKLDNLTEERVLRWLDNEVMMFLRYILWQGDAKLSTMLSADFSALNSNTLMRYYGLPSRPDTDVSPATDGRLGLLMQASFLTGHKSATSRGLFIRNKLLCQSVPAPPLEADMNLEGLSDDLAKEGGMRLSPREVRAKHLEDPQCSGCHAFIDELGFPFDGFDTSGRPRDMWDGFPIDTAGKIVGTKAIDGAVSTPQELIQSLAQADEVHDCFVIQLYSYVHGRAPGQEDTCYIERLQQRFKDSGGDVRDLMIELVTGPEAYQRTPLWD